MKKLIAFALALLLIASMTIPAYAATEIPDISDDIKIEFPEGFWDKWFKEHPIEVPDLTTTPETEPTEPEESEVIVTELSTPVITDAKYVHNTNYYGTTKCLKVSWSVVDGADSYLVMITKADGNIDTYVTSTNMLYLKNAECPKVYVEKTSTWTSASVRVMAVTGDVISKWSDLEKISCDKRH